MSKKPLAVVKVGGDVLLGEAEREGLASNVRDLVAANWQVIILHGGGPQTNQLQLKLGITPNKVAGRRITSKADLLVVEQAICGEVNVALTQLLQYQGLHAFGCHGASGKLITAVKRPPIVVSGAGSHPIDFGEVGDVTGINHTLLQGLLDLQLLPVIATLGVEANSGRVFNINADTTVVQIAREMKADLLLLTTAIGAIYKDLANPQSRLAKIEPEKAQQLIAEGVIQGGMIPKVEEALKVLKAGVKKIAIVGPQEQGAFLSVAKGAGNLGTLIEDAS